MKRNFITIEQGAVYELPKYRVIDGKGIELVKDIDPIVTEGKYKTDYEKGFQTITFVRGDKIVISEEEYKVAKKEAKEHSMYLPESKIKYMVSLSPEKIKEHKDKYNKAIEVIKSYENPIPRVDGILHEQLLAMMISDLQYKSSLVPSRETALAITKLQEALMWLEERQRDREARNVQGTYIK